MDFIKDLYEARMTRNSNNVKVLTYTDCCERLYLSLLVLELLQKYPTYSIAAQKYAQQSTVRQGYSVFSMTGSDLYNFIYFVTGDELAMSKLKDPEAAMAVREKTTLPTMAVNRYLTQVANKQTPIQISALFMKLEGALHISNSRYKAVRRELMSYERLNKKQRENVVTTLLLACRAKLRSADIIDELERLAADGNLETERVVDNEPTISVPDITMQGSDLMLYRYIVGSKNLHMAKLFVEKAKQGSPTNGQMNKAYMPAIEMLDDIVTAGPAYIQQLKALHKRALRGRK